MNLRIWLLLMTPMFVLTGLPAYGDIITLQDLLHGDPGHGNTCISDPDTPGCWTLVNQNSDGTTDGGATGTASTGLSDVSLIGSDANTFDAFGGIAGPLVDSFGQSLSTLTQFTTIVSDAHSGDLTFDWFFTTADAGSFYDPAGYVLCAASPTGFPGGVCGFFQLTTDIDAVNAPDPLNLIASPFAESGTVTITLAPGDVFGAYVLTADNLSGAGTIVFADTMASAPEPASFLLIGGGLLALGGARRKARRG